MKNTQKNVKKTGRKYAQIASIRLISRSKEEVLMKISDFLVSKHKFKLFTPNPEIVLASMENSDYANTLNSADILLPDGVGLKYAAKFLDGIDLNIIPGRKFFFDLVNLAEEKSLKIFLLGGRGGVAGRAEDKLRTVYKKVSIESFQGPILDKGAHPLTIEEELKEREAIEKINKFKPDILFVAFGAPKQERWIENHLNVLNIGGAMAIGGTLDYIAGGSRIPPAWIEDLGLEWLWRLIKEPGRLGRIFKAVVIFPLKVIALKIFA